MRRRLRVTVSPTVAREVTMSLRSVYTAAPLLVVLVFAPPASASAEARSDPLDARAPVPALKYQSSLTGYRRFADEKPAPWKEANETAARIGGWRAYARETQQGDAPGPSVSAPAAGAARSAPASAPAAGHQGHK
jgi:hypothetical protein